MFRSETPEQVGNYIQHCVEPMAQRLGLDYHESIFDPPTSEEALALDAYRCGQSLLMTFTYPDGWPIAPALRDRRHSKLARKASKVFRDALLSERGPNAISYMTQGYAQEMAELWRRAANRSDDEVETTGLHEAAARSNALGEVTGRLWPVTDPFNALRTIEHFERQRVTDLDNPNAAIDLRAYFGRARVACSAVALALGDELENCAADFFYLAVSELHLEFAVALQHDWIFQAEIWHNLLSDEPAAYAEFLRR